jgi:flagellar protein FliO/FliZ
MGLLDFLRAVLALSVTLGLIGLAAVGLRRYAPRLLGRMQARPGRKRRMQVIETLVLDPARRLVLVRVGEEERLVLLGEGKELSPPQAEAVVQLAAARSPPILRGSTR